MLRLKEFVSEGIGPDRSICAQPVADDGLTFDVAALTAPPRRRSPMRSPRSRSSRRGCRGRAFEPGRGVGMVFQQSLLLKWRLQWEAFIRHLCEDGPFPWNHPEGDTGVQLAEAGLQSRARRRRIDIPELELRSC